MTAIVLKDNPPSGTRAKDGCAFFVTAISGDKAIALLGPFDVIDDALSRVEEGKRLANEVDPRAHWYAYGTAQAPRESPVAFPDALTGGDPPS